MSAATTRKALLVVNPTAGGGRAAHRRPAVEEALVDAGWGVRTVASRDAADVVRIAAEADVDELVVGLGGDGTHGLLAHGVEISGACLAALPGGRGNDFVRALGLPMDAAQAARAVAVGRERRIGLGIAEAADRSGRAQSPRTFLGVVSIGFSALASALAASSRLRGPTTYHVAAGRAVVSVPRVRYRVTTDGQAREWAGYELAVGHSGWYGGGLHVCPSADLADDLLDVTAITAPKAAFPMVIGGMFSGRHVRRSDVATYRARRITVAADVADDREAAHEVWTDGEPVGHLPVTAWVRPGAVRVRA